uniref:Uncharacterized protein n=1 Tax=Rhizophora mucronata TaxID=61149 RepID=A0A2P2PDX8_RHIMU
MGQLKTSRELASICYLKVENKYNFNHEQSSCIKLFK